MEARYLRSNWEVDYHASRLSMRSKDTTLVFAGLKGSSSRRQTLSFYNYDFSNTIPQVLKTLGVSLLRNDLRFTQRGRERP